MIQNPLNHPVIKHLVLMVQARLERVRGEESSLGASAIELAIITAILAGIAIAIGTIIYNRIRDTANNINTNVPTYGP
jgi:hypothetical protein